MPEVSVVIPAYNSARFLTEAIESVLAQEFRDLEIVVVDDGSTDETEEVLRGYSSRVRAIRQKNSGVAIARNRGIEESRGRYVAFLDADDTWVAAKLKRQIAALAQSKTGDRNTQRVCYSAFTIVGPDLTPIGVTRSRREASALEDLLLRGNVVATPSTVIGERSLFIEAGGFDPALSQCADWDMWVRLAALTDFIYIDEPLVNYRQHGQNMSRDAALLERDSLRVLEKGFAMSALTPRLRSRRSAAFARNYMVLAGTYFHARRYLDFFRCASRAIAGDFRQAGYLMAFPARLRSRLRAARSEPTA